MSVTLLNVALGGAIGASARYLMAMGITRVAGPGMPLGVLTVNVAGCLLMGLFVGLSGRLGLAWLGPFFATGLLGGFTTFSTFSFEAIILMQEGQTGTAFLYMALSVGAGLGALYLGLELARAMA